MAVSISKEAREYAKANDLPLFQVSLDLRHMSPEAKAKVRGATFMGKSEISGACTKKAAKDLFNVLVMLREQGAQ